MVPSRPTVKCYIRKQRFFVCLTWVMGGDVGGLLDGALCMGGLGKLG
jgi:hypothetical protein